MSLSNSRILPIKALSVNACWQGRRYLTGQAKAYIEQVLWLLPKMKVPMGKLSVKLVFYLSSKNCDADNGVKVFVDCLAKKYGFNDKMIYHYDITKIDCKKEEEKIEFEITKL